MPSFSTQVAHQLGKEQATERLKGFLEKVRERYQDQVSSLHGAWEENVLSFSLTTYGFKIDGDLTVDDEVCRLEGQLPFAALAFRGKIQQSIATALERALQ